MKVSGFLHCAFRSSDPVRIGKFYARLFECDFFIHPVLSGLGIVMVKIANPESVYRGLLEFWPLDLHWDGVEGCFRRVAPGAQSAQTHVALRVDQPKEEILEALRQGGIDARYELRGPGFQIVCFDDPDGNFVEVFPNIETVAMPPDAHCSLEDLEAVMAEKAKWVETVKRAKEGEPDVYPMVYHPMIRSLSLPRSAGRRKEPSDEKNEVQ